MPDGSVLLVEIARRHADPRVPDGTVDVVADSAAGPTARRSAPTARSTSATTAASLERARRHDRPSPAGPAAPTTPAVDPRVDLDTGGFECSTPSATAALAQGPNDIVFDAARRLLVHRPRQDAGRATSTAAASTTPPTARRIVRSPSRSTPNGVGLSPDGGRGLRGRELHRPAPGMGHRGPAAAGAPAPRGPRATKGHFDSLAVEADGRVVVAAFHKGLCVVVRPDGSTTTTCRHPDRFTTNVCFTGDDMRTALANALRIPGGWLRSTGPGPAFASRHS